MREIKLDEVFEILDSKRDLNIVVIVNAYVINTVYCIDEFQYEIKENEEERLLSLSSKNGLKDYYEYHGIYMDLNAIDRISCTDDTIYMYFESQLVKIKYNDF